MGNDVYELSIIRMREWAQQVMTLCHSYLTAARVRPLWPNCEAIVYFFLKSVANRGLGAVDPDDFANEFRLMTIQRGLKATGTFSYQTAVSGRGTVYQPFIQPTLEIVLQAALWLDRFPTLQRMLNERIN